MEHSNESRQGARAALETLRRLDLAEPSESMAGYFSDRDQALATILDAAGPMPARAAGVLAVLAEHFLVARDAGIPDLAAWQPEATMTRAALAATRKQMTADFLA